MYLHTYITVPQFLKNGIAVAGVNRPMENLEQWLNARHPGLPWVRIWKLWEMISHLFVWTFLVPGEVVISPGLGAPYQGGGALLFHPLSHSD